MRSSFDLCLLSIRSSDRLFQCHSTFGSFTPIFFALSFKWPCTYSIFPIHFFGFKLLIFIQICFHLKLFLSSFHKQKMMIMIFFQSILYQFHIFLFFDQINHNQNQWQTVTDQFILSHSLHFPTHKHTKQSFKSEHCNQLFLSHFFTIKKCQLKCKKIN